jgi:hypothetical protein
MNRKNVLAVVLISVFAASGGVLSAAQAPSASQAEPGQAPPAHSWTTEQIVTATVRQAWQLGGKTEEGFFQIVQALTEIAAQNRGITLPDTKEAGTKAGNWIKREAKKDPDQLLYAIVDRAVQYTAKHPSAGM